LREGGRVVVVEKAVTAIVGGGATLPPSRVCAREVVEEVVMVGPRQPQLTFA
jgi:hypothetical protein